MAIMQETLERAGIDLTPERFEALVLEAVAQLPARGPATDVMRELPVDEIAALRRGGFAVEPQPREATSMLARTATTFAALLATSWTVTDVAAALGVDASRVRQRLLARTLYGIKLREGWQLPAWQFDGDALLPGLDRVLPALNPALHPVAVLRWMTTPNTDLEADGMAFSPRDWLWAGYDPARVVDLAATVGMGL